MRFLNLVAAVLVSFVDGVLFANLVTVFSSSAVGAVALLLSWILLGYLLYRYPNPRILIGSIVLTLGMAALLIPLGFLAVGGGIGELGPLAGLLGAIAFGLILGPLGLVLGLIGFWLISQGLRRHRSVTLTKLRAGTTKFCTSCGAQVPVEASFCSQCGSKQGQVHHANVS